MPAAHALFAVATIVAALHQTPAPTPPSPVGIDVVTVPSVLLTPADLSVTVDGRPRKVISTRPILRGPGAERAAAEAPATMPPVAEPSRVILIAVDQNSLTRGSEKKTSSMVARVLDLIGSSDRAALIPLPLERSTAIIAGTDRRPLWSALGRIRVGASAAPLALARAEEPAPFPDDDTPQPKNASSDPRPPGERDRQATSPRNEAPQAPAETRRGILGDVRGLLAAVRELPGPKILLLVRGTAAPDVESRPEAEGSARLDATGLLQAAAEARATLHALTLGDRWRGRDDEVARMARLSGGDEFRLGKSADLELQRLGSWMTEGLRLVIEGLPGDLDGRPHMVAVTTTRRTAAVRAPERWVPFDAPEPPAGTASQPAASAGSAPAAQGRPPGAETKPADADLQRVLARMSAYVAEYVEDFSAVVAEETYEQRVTSQLPRRMSGPTTRKLRSDFLLVRIPGNEQWTPFRDVFEVNDEPIRDRDDRLRKLFIDMPPDALDRARQILDEGARYNLGSMYRNVNLPVLPLVFLMPRYLGGLQFNRAGQEGVEGVHVWRIDFQETGRPTVIRNDKEGRDIPVSGSLWVDPITGRIVRTRIRIQDATLRMDTTVTYRRSDTLHLWAPAEMEELYISGAERLAGTAKYRNFRKFRVEVEEHVAVPKT